MKVKKIKMMVTHNKMKKYKEKIKATIEKKRMKASIMK